jgi:hemerythrin-like domain-containing protein
MKRNENLETLSWEHHDGLVVAFRLQQGIKKGTQAVLLSKYILHFWEHALQRHFWQEEQTLNQHLDSDTQGKLFLNQMMEEHRAFRILIKQLRKNGTNNDNIAEFAARLNRHIRFEERMLFPFIEKVVSTDQLADIGSFLHKYHKHGGKEWKPRFWVD